MEKEVAGASFMLFLTGLRQVHNAHHYALGLSRRATEWFLFAMSVVMLGAMHAVQFNHLRHHKLCMAEGDAEAVKILHSLCRDRALLHHVSAAAATAAKAWTWRDSARDFLTRLDRLTAG